MPSPQRVVILGGGMGGMAAAWKLSDPQFADEIESITVYQRGWRLGGKGASSRGANGRIEEHGLHVWLGYYENAFSLLQEVYADLDRPVTDPNCVIKTWRDALEPATEVGLADLRQGAWHHWVGDFAPNELTPGDGQRTESMTPAAFINRAIGLLQDFFVSRNVPEPTQGQPATSGVGWSSLRGALGAVIEITRIGWDLSAVIPNNRVRALIQDLLAAAQHALLDVARDDDDVRQTWELASVVVASIKGIVAHSEGGRLPDFRSLNKWDYREWIMMHGAAPEAADSTLVRGLYDLVFGYEDGDTDKPGFGAGLGVFLSGKTFFDYKGAIFWKMQAGMGDIVFAPMYQALRRRGVRFEFFHNVENIALNTSGDAIESIRFGRHAIVSPDLDQYDPLTRVGELPVFRSEADPAQLVETPMVDSESWWSRDEVVDRVEIAAGSEFDQAVFAIPVGMARLVTTELGRASPDWQGMVDGIGVVGTQALQVWLNEPEEQLGWTRPGVTISGFVKPFDTWASMPQLIEVEQWPDDDTPRAIEYFCATLPVPRHIPLDPDYLRAQHELVYQNARTFLDEHLEQYLPGAVDDGGFRWELLCGATGAGPSRLRSQFWRANVDPSDLYVQSLPGTDQLRLRADQSGFERLVLAGDWTDNGVNAGCIESATLSGIQAANAILARPLMTGVIGTYLPLNEREVSTRMHH